MFHQIGRMFQQIGRMFQQIGRMFQRDSGTSPLSGGCFPKKDGASPEKDGTFPQALELSSKSLEHSPKEPEHFSRRLRSSPCPGNGSPEKGGPRLIVRTVSPLGTRAPQPEWDMIPPVREISRGGRDVRLRHSGSCLGLA
jgi:hypothetical protein